MKRIVVVAAHEAFKLAESAAKTARLAKKADAKPYQFAINFRLDSKTPSAKGDYNARYKALTDLVKVLGHKPWHYATSSWEVRSHQSPKKVLAALSKPLDPRIDVLTVTPIGASEVFGAANTL